MLPEETLNGIAKVLGVENGSKLKELITSDENQTLEVPKLYTQTDFDTFGNNRFNEGKGALESILSKQVFDANELGLPEADRKDFNKVLEAYGKKRENDIKAQFEGKQLNPDEKKQLQDLISTERQKAEQLKNDYESKILKLSTNNTLQGLIKGETVIPKNDLVDLFHLKYNIQRDDNGSTVVIDRSNNTVLKDDVANYLTPNQVFETFSSQYIKKSPGMGGADEKPDFGSSKGKIDFSSQDKLATGMDEYQKVLKQRGLSPYSSQASEIFQKMMKGEKY